MPSPHVLSLCTGPDTVTTAYAAHPHGPIKRVRKRLYPKLKNVKVALPLLDQERPEERLDKAARCGKFPHRPSDLFLQVFNDALGTLDRDPLANMVSPPLFGASGVIPLSIVSVIPDIMRHYAELIVSARAEVFLATNYWEPSLSSSIISDSIRELSKRVCARPEGERQPVVFKLMYDRGSLHQLVNNHVTVPSSMWAKVNLPRPEDIPGVTLEVINYHRPPLGTFHAKYLVVDRRVACINSNNIQDRPNIEMMVHLEGPIVDSFYDVALLSWSNAMKPPLPLLAHPHKHPEPHDYKFDHDNEFLKYIDQEATSKATREFLNKQHTLDFAQTTEVLSGLHRWRAVAQQFHDSHHQPQHTQSHSGPRASEGGGEDGEESAEDQQMRLLAAHPNMMVPHASKQKVDTVDAPADEAGKNHGPDGTEAADKNDVAATSAHPHADADPSSLRPRHDDTASSSADGDDDEPSSVSEEPSTAANTSDRATSMSQASMSQVVRIAADLTAADVAKRLNIGKIELDATVADDGVADFRPYILHTAHTPVPIAMVNRKPTGTPGHRLNNPQDKAWLSALRNARKSVFIQTPTFNAAPLIPATLDACRRGVEVTLYLDLGFNDQGEQIPFQGGTNEMVVNRMYRRLNAEKKGNEKNLKVYWYTGKDQKRPISAAAKKRNCHVKFMAVDDQIAIFGNGNQDTQSWFHSMEINVLVDSPALVRDWLAGIDANQNTRAYGRVSSADGIWRDGDEVLQASGVGAPTVFTWLRSVSNQVHRLFLGKF